jgi:hypothetical protein
MYVIHWRYTDNSAYGIVGVFDDKKMAEAVFDALEAAGDAYSRIYYLDDYPLNQVKK